MTTFGYSTLGANDYGATPNNYVDNAVSNRYTAITGDVVTQLSFGGFCLSGGPYTVQVGIYVFSGGVPTTLVGSGTITVSAGSPAWTSISVNIPLTAGVVYVVAFGNKSNDNLHYLFDTTDTVSIDGNGGALSNPWVETSTSTGNISMYATVSNGTTETITTSLDSYLQKPGITKTASLDALLTNDSENNLTLSLDSLLEKGGKTKTASLDAYLKQSKSKGLSLDGILYAVYGDLFLTAPLPILDMETAFNVADLDFVAPLPQLEITDTMNVGVLNLIAPLPILEIETKNFIGVLSLVAPKPQLEISDVKGLIDELFLLAPLPKLEISSIMGHSGDLILIAPIPQLEIVSLSGTYRCIVLNIDKWIVSEYENFEFDYFFKFKGNYYGANANGIFLLDSSSKESGSDIDASFETGLDDFGERNLKKIHKLFVNIKSNGTTRLKVYGDEKDLHSIANLENTGDLPKNRRIPVNRMKKAIYYNFEFSNVEGADFDFYGLEIFPQVLGRRINGE
jgi:hypothetical protein